jgi:phenylacetate-coenzyme A ligase PaaK-like adenylate-forming protein
MALRAPVFDAWRTACAYADALTVSRAPASAWHSRRDERLGELLHDVAPRSRLVAERLWQVASGATAMQALQAMAPLRKAEAMRRFGDWVTDDELSLPALRAFAHERAQRGEPVLGRYMLWESSGSGGEPGLFLQDSAALAAGDAIEAARGPLSLSPKGALAWALGPRIALVGAVDGHFASVVSFERTRALNPWLQARSRSFSFLQPIARLVEQLQAFAPTVLATYPSMAWVLSQEQAAGRLSLSLEGLWTGGETLTHAVRRELGERFAVTVRDSYGASECLFIANECRCGHLHLNADWVILEPVDAAGRPVPEGEMGATTWLTNLANRVQPIIRWDLGDRMRFVPGPCACGGGLPRIEVQGRSGDVLTFDGRDGRAVHLSPLALTTVLEDEAGVFDFQLRQRGNQSLHLTLHAPCDAKAAARAGAALRGLLARSGVKVARVNVRRDARAAARGRSGKQPRVIRAAA